MKITEMSRSDWNEVKSTLHDTSEQYEGREVLYLKGDLLEWFDDPKLAKERGFLVLALQDIPQIVSKALNVAETSELVTEYSIFLKLIKGSELEKTKDPNFEELKNSGEDLVNLGLTIPDQRCVNIGNKLLKKAANIALQQNNPEGFFNARVYAPTLFVLHRIIFFTTLKKQPLKAL